jgi:hypothetical protein
MKNFSSIFRNDGGVIRTDDRKTAECRMTGLKHLTLQAFLLAWMMMPLDGSGQSREYLLKAGYIEKFTHFIEWPG